MSKSPPPPRLAFAFLAWFCKDDLLEEIEGDLYEEFSIRAERNLTWARWMYAWQVLSFFRPFAMKHSSQLFPRTNIMITHYTKIAFRAFGKQKLSATINVLSLSLGLAVVILIYLFVQNEITFDRYHTQGDQIFRVKQLQIDGDGNVIAKIPAHPLGFHTAVAEAIPEVEGITPIFSKNSHVKSNHLLREDRVIAVDASMFSMFTYQVIDGTLDQVLTGPQDVVITESMAKLHFGTPYVVGKTLDIRFIDEYATYKIAAVIADPPPNSSLPFSAAVPFSVVQNHEGYAMFPAWSLYFLPEFIHLREDADLQLVVQKLGELAEEHQTYELKRLSEQHGEGVRLSYELQPLTDLHWDKEHPSNLHAPGDRDQAFILGGIGLIILLIACINFTILALGRSTWRGREIGLRKVVGARRRQIIHQFLGESIVLAFLSLVTSILLAALALPEFGQVASRNLNISALWDPRALAFLVLLTLVTGLLAGAYPAVILSRFKPVSMFGRAIVLGGRNRTSSTLILTQFVLSTTLVIITLVMSDQLRYMAQKELGYQDDLLVVIDPNGQENKAFFNHFKNEMANHPGVVEITATAPTPSKGVFTGRIEYNEEQIEGSMFYVETNYLETMGMELAEGRFFSELNALDSIENIVVNEAFVRELGLENPVGSVLSGFNTANVKDPVIIGVVKDFHYQSMEYAIKPAWMKLEDLAYMHDLVIRISPVDVQGTLAELEQCWKRLSSDMVFQYTFLEDDVARQYAQQERWAKVVQVAGILATAVAYLGLFGLIALSLASRMREISIRKVLGANFMDVSITLSARYLKMITLAGLVAIPIAWYIGHTWLQYFAYHVDIHWSTFVFVMALLVALFLLTIAYHLVQSQRINPADTLGKET
ncbi:MAG: ABC transporter permease [Bacteroidota bacterium]